LSENSKIDHFITKGQSSTEPQMQCVVCERVFTSCQWPWQETRSSFQLVE